MEWTGALYADTPTAEASVYIGAPLAKVWNVVTDIELMPIFSTELKSAAWVDPVRGPQLGNSFTGTSRHPKLGEWSTTSYVVECDAPRAFSWAVGNAETPGATWRFTLELEDDGTRLRQWVRMGPGPSGLSIAIAAMPEKEQKIVFVRMRELEQAIEHTLAAIKTFIEGEEH
ncbi:SRPBCC family protein [Nocardia lijiangensis]|uniref:SRPBCC family protein n=1 Tax=Nocardia lijiangensis TaxID=299618 RepID=UPI003D71D48D